MLELKVIDLDDPANGFVAFDPFQDDCCVEAIQSCVLPQAFEGSEFTEAWNSLPEDKRKEIADEFSKTCPHCGKEWVKLDGRWRRTRDNFIPPAIGAQG